jgi:hypothetical protein
LIRIEKIKTTGRPRIIRHAVSRDERAQHYEKNELNEISQGDVPLNSFNSYHRKPAQVIPWRLDDEPEETGDGLFAYAKERIQSVETVVETSQERPL